MPITMTPKKSNRPQALSQARNTGPSDIMTAIKTINSNAITQASDAVQRRQARAWSTGISCKQNHQRRRYGCGRNDKQHAEQRRVRPDRAVGHRKQDSGVAGDVEAKKPADHWQCTLLSSAGGTNFAPRWPGQCDCLQRALPRKDIKANIPNIKSAHEPTDIGDQNLNIG